MDIPTINILEEYLQSFEGAIIFVSHDRYFVDKIAQRLYVFRENGEIMESHTSFSEYLEIESELREYATFAKELESDSMNATKEGDTQSAQDSKEQPKKRKLSYKEKRLLEILPQEIESLEDEIKELERLFGKYSDISISGDTSTYARGQRKWNARIQQVQNNPEYRQLAQFAYEAYTKLLSLTNKK